MGNWRRPPWQGTPALVAPEPETGGCPMCGSKGHVSCKFQAGSLYCITHNCANPHHRSVTAPERAS